MAREWRTQGFFKNTKPDLNLEKNIPENCLLYINQSYISTVRHGDLAVYHHNFIISQLIVAEKKAKFINTFVKIMELNCSPVCMI